MRHCLTTCLNQTFDDFEILVSDNSDGEALPIVRDLGDSRVRYVRPPKYLPMSPHWDFMLSHAAGEVITILGDDDGLMPHALSTAAALLDANGRMPLQHAVAHYMWPDVPDPTRQNTYRFFHDPGAAVKIVDCREYISALARCRARYFDGPMVYHHFVPAKVLRSLTRNNSIFHASSPDVYTSITVALNTASFISTNHVLTVAGESAKSNGAQTRSGGPEADRFFNDLARAGKRPRVGIHAIILATLDGLLEAADRYDRPDILSQIDYAAFYLEAVNESLALRFPLREKRVFSIFADSANQGVIWQLVAETMKAASRLGFKKVGGKHEKPPGWQIPQPCPDAVHNVADAVEYLYCRLGSA